MSARRLSILTMIVAAFAACAPGQLIQSDRPSYAGEAPSISEEGFAEHVAERIVPLAPRAARALYDEGILDAGLSSTEKISAPRAKEPIVGVWPAIGARRRVLLEDGTYVAEDVLENESPARFRYQAWGFTSATGAHIDYAIGEFEFLDAGDGATRIVWRHRMKAKSALARAFIARFVKNDFAPFMERGLSAFALEAQRRADNND